MKTIAIVTGASGGLGRAFVEQLTERPLDEIWCVARDGEKPVSYTHLDVYKRQV